jgi:hypothetical protein
MNSIGGEGQETVMRDSLLSLALLQENEGKAEEKRLKIEKKGIAKPTLSSTSISLHPDLSKRLFATVRGGTT